MNKLDQLLNILSEFEEKPLPKKVTSSPKAEPKKDTDPNKEDKWAIVVAEFVVGKSKGPKGFERYKPYPYDDSYVSHKIVYAHVFDANDTDAKNYFHTVKSEMKNIQSKSGGGYNVKSWAIDLHNITNDKSQEGTELYVGDFCSNKLLKDWDIIE